MTSQETDARADLVAKQKAVNDSIPGLQKVVDAETANVREVAKDGSPGQIVTASGVLSKAQTALDGAEGDVDKLARGIKALDKYAAIEKSAHVLEPAAKPVGDKLTTGKLGWDTFMFPFVLTGNVAVDVLPAAMRSQLPEDVKTVAIRLDVGEKLFSIKPTGATARVPRTGGGGGFSKRLYRTPAGDMSQTDVFKNYAADAGVTDERIAAVLADPSNQGISHRGKAVASKLGFEEVTTS